MFVVLITSIANAQNTTFDFDCGAEGTLQYELNKIFASSTAPSDDIDDYPGIKNNSLVFGDVDAKQARIAALDGDGYLTQFNQNTGISSSFSDNQGNEFAMDEYDSDTANAGSLTRIKGDDWSRLYLAMVTAKWYLLNPNVSHPDSVEGKIAAMYDAANPPTSLDNVINNAAGDAYNGSNADRASFIFKFDNYDLTFTGITDNGSSYVANYANNDIPAVAAPGGNNNFDEPNFKLWMLEIAKAIWLKGHPEYVYYSELRVSRIAEVTALVDASTNVEMSIVLVENFGEAFRITADPDISKDFATGIFETGVQVFERLGDTQWAEMKLRISDKINEIDADVVEAARLAELAALRTTRINVINALDKNGVTVQMTTTGDQTLVFKDTELNNTFYLHVDDYGNGNGKIEDLTPSIYDDYKADIILARDDLDPANAIYGFTSVEFNAASLQDKVDKAFDIAKANYDSYAVSGSFTKGIIHGSKITLRVAADNYPLELKPEMAHDANYEGWKTYIDRILYLVKTGDGSERNTRENHINGIAWNISVEDLDGGDDDWAVAWNDLPFIYGGSDENDHDTNYDTHGNTSRVFAGYHQDNIGLLPGVVYEALLVEVHRINGYVIAADALRRHQDGGINKEREMGIKALLTGNASFHENASAEWFILNDDVTVWTNSKYGPICDVPGYLWLGKMDNYSFRYMYIIIRNELIRNDDSIRYYNNVNQNIYCL